MAEVFISSFRREREFVRRRQASLAARQLNAWVDRADILVTAEWFEEI